MIWGERLRSDAGVRAPKLLLYRIAPIFTPPPLLQLTLDLPRQFAAVHIQQRPAQSIEEHAMRSDDPAVDELPVCRRRTNGAKIVLIVDPNPGEPFGAAGTEVAHFEDGGWHGTRGYGSGI